MIIDIPNHAGNSASGNNNRVGEQFTSGEGSSICIPAFLRKLGEESGTPFLKADYAKFQQKIPINLSEPSYGKLDLVIAFDTTGSMASYVGNVKKEISSLIPMLFSDNEDLKLGIVAFGDYCDMENREKFGKAYQCHRLSSNKGHLMKFVCDVEDTYGGDTPEFYELVIRKIVTETKWRPDSSRSVLLIADSTPHLDTDIDWMEEAYKAAEAKVRFDTVRINDQEWMRQLSAITGGISVPFKSSSKTVSLILASVLARGSGAARARFDAMAARTSDPEIKSIFSAYSSDRAR